MPSQNSIPNSSVIPTLTSLPLDLIGRILRYVCDENLHQHRSFLRRSNCSLFYRYFEPQITIDGAQHVHSPFSKSLLAPALASPVLAAAINQIVELTYLTDLNTENQLSLWLQTFAPYVQAVSTGHIAEQSFANLSSAANIRMVYTLCGETIQLFKTITLNHLKLNVLDLVHVPFDKFQPMHDHIVTGLCAALETTQNTLQQLSLPIYSQSDLCPRALEMVTLPHLKLLSVELKNAPDSTLLSRTERKRLRLPFLRIIQAVEGHADRNRSLTTLDELRFINLYSAPCTSLSRSGCSPAFFRAVTTLRAAFNPFCTSDSHRDVLFFLLFRKLKYLYWSRKPHFWDIAFRDLCARLKELHLCDHRSISGLQVGTEIHEPPEKYVGDNLFFSTFQTFKRIVTLVSRFDLDPDLVFVPDHCPRLQYLSLVITCRNAHYLGEIIAACWDLTGLDIIIAERDVGPLRKAGWQTLEEAFLRNHSGLSQVAIQTKRSYRSAVPVDTVTKCFVHVVNQLGSYAERLVFRAFLKDKSLIQVSNALRCVVDACKGSLSLTHLEVDIDPGKSRITAEDIATASEALMDLKESRDELLQLCDDLGKIDFGCCHRYVTEPFEI